ncbi:crotonobetainyl-CoA:carnitine CoA-transferase CaiB-like acyl-CoA transferase [Nocardiopsis sp. Huas11]|uniref:CaiB/BaiF CoA transferase family protein n=1 Tax=Nocardiopsis sp. Huas11 TaxID=2183912 RepID=UPI000EB19EA3|nr:CoA transferase [Nocardiopsis sp. Huas11]RKS09897.1 crotonobetainyl-CoA:carnitine CoA-transferase CaiB-like acyl-CoA transferase [Nocardiopsis sp. Huas11]
MTDTPSRTAPLPLAGVRVADLSRVLAGPYATMLLADMGAEVVKVEQPGRGDDTRAWGPPWAGPAGGAPGSPDAPPGEAAYFLSVNRNKRSLAVDLKDPDGLAAVQDLCASSDVVVQNFRPGVAERLGLGYGAVQARNPAVVYCSVSGFGPEHEPAGRPGFDIVVQAESGLMATTGPAEGPASKVGVALTDVLTGLNAAVGILGALMRARATGVGEDVSVSLINSTLSGLVNLTQQALITGEEPARVGNAHTTIVPYQVFPTADADIVVAAGNDALYRRLCAAIDRADLAEDPRYATNRGRVAHREELVGALTATLASRGADHWMAVLVEAGVPVGRVRGVLDALRTADATGDDVLRTVEHPTAGLLEQVRAGFRLEGSPPPLTAPPLLGQHSRELLDELGVSTERVDAMVKRGAVQQADL